MLRRLTIAVVLAGTVSARAGAQFSNRDIEKFDAIKLLLDNRKALKIDDQQRVELEKLHVPVKWNIKKLAARIDSAQRDVTGGRNGMRGVGGSSDEPVLSIEAQRARILAARKVILAALVELQREHELTYAQAMGVLGDAQRPRATELVKKRGDELRRMVDDAGFGVEVRRDGGRGGDPPRTYRTAS